MTTFSGIPVIVERFGDLTVTGDGPWMVAVAETWIPDKLNQVDGVAVYVVVDDNGTTKIDKYYFAGQRVPVEYDFDSD